MKHKWIPKAVLGAGIAMLSMLWAPVFRSFHLQQHGWLNETMAIVGSVALVTTLYLLGNVGGWAAYTMASIIAGGSAWVVGSFIAAEYNGPISELLGPRLWWFTAILIAVLYDFAVIGAAMANRKAEREEENQADLEEQLEDASIAQARAEKEAAILRDQLKAAELAAVQRPSGRKTYAVRVLEELQGAESEWLTADELGGRIRSSADLRGPLGKLVESGRIARMTAPDGQRVYAAMVAGKAPDPPAHILPFKAGEVSS